MSETLKKAVLEAEQIVSRDRTQAEIDEEINSIVEDFSGLVVVLGHAGV